MKCIQYENWLAVLDIKTCLFYRRNHGKIFEKDEIYEVEPPVHFLCRCKIVPLDAKKAGTAMKMGVDGADDWLYYGNILPEYYTFHEEARRLGWKEGKFLSRFAPGKMLTKGRYYNTFCEIIG
jgi:hypothetical protein